MKKRKIVSTAKKGALSASEKALIQEWCTSKDDVDIATALNRNLMQVQKYKKEFLAGAPRIILKRTEADELRRELRASIEWKRLKDEFNDKELTFYENDYIEYRRQFKDLNQTESKQLHQLIHVDILMYKINKERSLAETEKEIAEDELKAEKAKPKPNKDEIYRLDSEIQTFRSLATTRNREHIEWMKKHSDLLKDLKGTRDQRMKAVTEGGKFMAVLKALEIDEKRNSMAEITGLMDIAVEKERERLSEPHKFGFFKETEIEQPLLNHETVRDINEDQYLYETEPKESSEDQ